MKHFMFAILAIYAATAAFGQQNKFDIGLEGGPSRTFLRGNEILEQLTEPTIGVSGGLFLQYNFSKLISIRTNFAIERKGAIANAILSDINGNTLGNITDHYNFDYVTVPLLIRATLGHKMKFFFNAGPFLGYLIKATQVNEGPNRPKSVGDMSDTFNQFDWGVTAGLGVAIPIKEKFFISCEIRNNLGLYNISALAVANNGTIKTNSTNLLIGFGYKMGRGR